MTIDEAIKVLNKYNYEEVTMYEPEWDAINTLVRLADWYREQDLILRKDALERIENLKRSERHIDHVITLHHSYLAIMEIPKAEPKGCFDASLGDCETCIRFTDDDCAECNVCGDGVDYYEPYIPKEKEQ